MGRLLLIVTCHHKCLAHAAVLLRPGVGEARALWKRAPPRCFALTDAAPGRNVQAAVLLGSRQHGCSAEAEAEACAAALLRSGHRGPLATTG
jgi:hypothetical protein